jgi:hypothetical protein
MSLLRRHLPSLLASTSTLVIACAAAGSRPGRAGLVEPA